MFTEKKTKTTLSKALALGMVATSVSLAGQTTTADAAKNENTDTTSLYKTQTISSKTGTVTASSLNIRKGTIYFLLNRRSFKKWPISYYN